MKFTDLLIAETKAIVAKTSSNQINIESAANIYTRSIQLHYMCMYVRCELYMCICQVWTECGRCGLDVAGVDWMWQVQTGCDRCELDVTGVNWM